MKTIRSLYNFLMLFPVAGFFAGCYTHMETMRDGGSGGGDGDYYAYTDSTNAANDTTGANYFSDDDYRESNYRASFDYYTPPAYIWGSNICYDPWYDDCWYPGSSLVWILPVLGLWGTVTVMGHITAVDMDIAAITEEITMPAGLDLSAPRGVAMDC